MPDESSYQISAIPQISQPKWYHMSTTAILLVIGLVLTLKHGDVPSSLAIFVLVLVGLDWAFCAVEYLSDNWLEAKRAQAEASRPSDDPVLSTLTQLRLDLDRALTVQGNMLAELKETSRVAQEALIYLVNNSKGIKNPPIATTKA